MKRFKKIVGLLLCLAMVLSIVPATVVGAAEAAESSAESLSMVTGLATPTFGYYTDGNTDGPIISYFNGSYAPANLVDGNHSNQTRSQVYTYAEVTSGAKVPVILFELAEATSIAAVEVDVYKATYYSIDDFTIQVYTESGWTTVKEVTGAFGDAPHGEATDPELYTFDATVGTKVRILITKLSDMTAYADEDPEMATSTYIRLKEVTLYTNSDVSADTTTPTFPEGTETTMVMQKIDLVDCVVGCCSSPYNSSVSYKNQSWYSSSHSGWRNLNDFVDGNYLNEVHFGCGSPERGDIYIDLTRKTGAAVAVDQIKLYHGAYGDVPSVVIILELQDGTQIEKTFTLNWEVGVETEPLTWTFDQTYHVKGVYIWQNNNSVKAFYSEIEMFQLTEVAVPEPDVFQITDLAAPAFGYYADGNTDGSITDYYNESYAPANLIDGDHSTQTRSLSYTYNEIQTGAKVPAILFDLGKEISIAGVEVDGYEYGRYNMADFTIQVYDSTNTWVTVKTVKKAFDSSAGTTGEETEPVMYRFDAIVGSKVRILVNGVTFMGNEDGDQKTAVDSFRIREIALYEGYGEAPEEDTDADNTPSILDDLIVMEGAPTPAVGYYTDNDTDGTITDYYNSTHIPANMVNGNITDQARSGYYTHAEIASGAKIPVILFNFGSATVLGGMDIYGYETSRYNMEDFEVQVYTSEGWVTAASVTDAFYVEGSFGETLSGPLTVEFDQLYTGTQLRILVSGLSDMTADAAEDPEDVELAEGSYIRVREIQFYSEEAPGPYIETATLNGVDLSEYVIVYSADEPDYNLRAAKHIRTAIKQRTGRVLTIVEDDTAETDCEILVGDTNRSLSQSVTAPANNEMKFTIQSSGTKIALEADYFIIAGAAYYFTETYIDDADFGVTVSSETREPITEKANNYIMLIGDGMGVNQTKMFEAYDVPTSGEYAYSDGEDIFYGYYLPYQGLVQTSNASGTVTDSAAAGTALATGYKTINTRVGKDRYGNTVQNLSELALSLGMGAAVMTTEEIVGATPASFSSHVNDRSQSSAILTDQAKLRDQGVIIVDDGYYPYFTAEEWAAAEPTFINALNQVAKNDSFFLMYEEAYIDTNGHYGNAPWCFRTMYRFNQAIGFFMEFAMYNPDTLVLITADHETGNMQSNFTFTSSDHSSQNVPVFAYGEGAEVFATDTSYHNTSIARTFAYMMSGKTNFGDSQWPILGDVDEPEDPADPTDPTDPTEPTKGHDGKAPVVAPGTTTAGGEIKEGEIYAMISPKNITTVFGHYNDNGTFIDGNDGYCVTDGWYGRAGYSECTTADGQMVLIMTLKEVKNIGRVEIVGRSVSGASEHLPVDFEIQALVDGEWVTVADVNENPFTDGLTVGYTFPAVATNQIRILINAVNIPTNVCHLNEVELYEVTTGKLYNKINLTGSVLSTDAHDSAPIDKLIDGDKAAYFLGSNVTFNLTDRNGNPTSVDGFRLLNYRGDQAFASNVSVAVQTTPNGEFVSLGQFATNWTNGYPLEQVVVAFEETLVAYALQVNLDTYSYANELELFQYVREEERNDPPVITKQPAKAYVAAGKTAKFAVEATGTDLTYQWQSSADGKTWKNCTSSKATSATFTFTAKSSHSSNYYRCVITDAAGNEITTDAVKLYVVGVVTQPKTQKVAVGEKVKYTVKATGASKTYQWQSSTDGKTWKNCSSSSAKYATFTFTSKTSHSSNYYRCKITDSKGNVVYTNAVRLYVLGVTTQPKTQKVAVGETVKYTVKATGAGKTYQWQSSTDGKTWKNCTSSKATSATFTFTAKTSHSSNYYRCVVKDNAGNVVYTDTVRLYVLGVTTQPKAKTVDAGDTVKFTVKATGASKTYQWQVSTDGGKTWKNCTSSSATSATFTFTGKDKHDGNYYRCRVKDSGGNTVYTEKVKLTVD